MTSTMPTDHPTGLISGRLDPGTLISRPSLSERADRLSSAVEALDNELGVLRGRIEPILGPSTPMPTKDTAGNRTSDESFLASFLQDITGRVHELTLVVGSLTSRVDL